jgi:hypothetical protein
LILTVLKVILKSSVSEKNKNFELSVVKSFQPEGRGKTHD